MVFECNLYTQYVYTPLVWQDQPWQKPRGKHSWPTATRACRLVFASVDPATLEKYKLKAFLEISHISEENKGQTT